MDIPKAFSFTLRQFRKESGLTHERLAELAGLHPTTISLLERAKRQPSVTTLVVLSEAMGIDPGKFLQEVVRARDKSKK